MILAIAVQELAEERCARNSETKTAEELQTASLRRLSDSEEKAQKLESKFADQYQELQMVQAELSRVEQELVQERDAHSKCMQLLNAAEACVTEREHDSSVLKSTLESLQQAGTEAQAHANWLQLDVEVNLDKAPVYLPLATLCLVGAVESSATTSGDYFFSFCSYASLFRL